MIIIINETMFWQFNLSLESVQRLSKIKNPVPLFINGTGFLERINQLQNAFVISFFAMY